MNESNPQFESETPPPPLHMGKFAPTKPGTPAAPTEEGPTLVIRRAAEKTAEESAQPVVAPKGSALPPKNLLGAVSYCYSKGVYRSEDIEHSMLKDPELRASIGNEVPDAHAIRRFRRYNREAILTTLGKFFRWRRAQAIVAAEKETGVAAPAASENTQFFVKTEAKDTVEKAAWVDNMSKDD